MNLFDIVFKEEEEKFPYEMFGTFGMMISGFIPHTTGLLPMSGSGVSFPGLIIPNPTLHQIHSDGIDPAFYPKVDNNI